ncbi:MAG TPA: hypothetical protein VHM24_06870 [Gemmatimonadaceae bacterium]|nr:hypothetical protein [Gemmatimonadaceae bacterium]
MTASDRVRSAQRILTAGAVTHALVWALAAAVGLLAITAFASLVAPALADGSRLESPAALAAAVIVFGVLMWRHRQLVSRQRVALWIEERIPELHYSLVTALDEKRSVFADEMETAVGRQDVGGVIFTALRRRLVPALGAAIAAALLLYVSPSATFGGGGLFRRLGGSSPAAIIPAGSRLQNLSVRVVPPPYTRQSSVTLDDPSSISAIAGSRIIVRGKGTPAGIMASVNAEPLRVTASGGGWTLSLAMPSKPAALNLADRGYDRIIVVNPHADAPPRVALNSPPRDTTLRVAKLIVNLAAAATDDIGLGMGYFECLITTGSGEIFTARTVTTPIVTFDGSRSGSLSAKLDLAALKLGQGDVVSIRAIVQDRNTLSGPGLATSDTRTFRIARADEYDSVAVDPAGPLPVDSSAMSQRMLILMAEKLVKDQKTITRAELVKRSGEIGDLEDRVRKRVHEILFEIEGGGAEEEDASAPPEPEKTLEGEESDNVYAVQNPDLFQAYQELWAAVRSLQIAEPQPALPHMRAALKALDRARLANRLYLRGIPPKVIVDLARVRMTGKEKGTANSRTPGSAADSARALLERRFTSAVELIPRNAAGALRELTMLQVEALSTAPAFAGAIGEAIDAFRKSRDATIPLLRARRALSGDPVAKPGLSPWTGGW